MINKNEKFFIINKNEDPVFISKQLAFTITKKDINALFRSWDALKVKKGPWEPKDYGWYPQNAEFRNYIHETAAIVWNNASLHHDLNGLRKFYTSLPSPKARDAYLITMTENFPVKFTAATQAFKKNKKAWDTFHHKQLSSIKFLPNIRPSKTGISTFDKDLSPNEFIDIYLEGIIKGRQQYTTEQLTESIDILTKIRDRNKKEELRKEVEKLSDDQRIQKVFYNNKLLPDEQ